MPRARLLPQGQARRPELQPDTGTGAARGGQSTKHNFDSERKRKLLHEPERSATTKGRAATSRRTDTHAKVGLNRGRHSLEPGTR